MKIKELKKILKNYDDDMEILMSSDAEGNSYDFLSDVNLVAYKTYDRHVEIGLSELTDKLREQGYTEEDLIEDGKIGIVLYP